MSLMVEELHPHFVHVPLNLQAFHNAGLGADAVFRS
jgi:hypothetical protein